MEDAGDQFEDDLLKAMQNSLEVNTVPLPAATQPNPAYRGMYNMSPLPHRLRHACIIV